jgi:F-box-like
MASLQYKPNLPKEIRQKIKLLSEHQTRISSLESQLQKARTSYKLLESELLEYRVEVASLKPDAALHSSLFTGIHALPDEVLLLVFEHFLSVSHRDIRHLLKVCKRWHRIVMSPRFWARIQLFPVDYLVYSKLSSALYIEACLQRSQPLLLDIELDYDDFRTCEGYIRSELEALVRAVADDSEDDKIYDWSSGLNCYFSSAEYDQYFCDVFRDLDVLIGPRGVHMERWRSIDLCVPWHEPDVAMDLWVKFVGHTPNLKRAKFTGLEPIFDIFVDPEDTDQLDLCFPTLSNITNLTLGDPGLNFFLTDFTISPSSLRHLDIEYDKTFSGISALSKFPLLRKLCLRTFIIQLDPDLVIPPAVVRLLDLQELRLMGNSHVLLKHVRFDLPNLQELLVDSGTGFYIPSSLSPTYIRWTMIKFYNKYWTPETIRSAILGSFQASDRVETLTVLESVRTAVLEVLSDLRQTKSLPVSLKSVVVELEGGDRDIIVV